MDCKSCKPYFWGMCIGLLQIPAFFSYGSLGASTPYENVAAMFRTIESFSYFNFLNNFVECFATTKSLWQLGIVFGIIIGAFLGKKMSGYKTSSLNQKSSTRIDPSWNRLMPSYSLLKRLTFAFVGGFLMILGARLALGCTSGNGISGMSLLFVGSYIVMGSMFFFGTITAFILYRRA